MLFDYMSIKTTILTPGTKTFNTNTPFLMLNAFLLILNIFPGQRKVYLI